MVVTPEGAAATSEVAVVASVVGGLVTVARGAVVDTAVVGAAVVGGAVVGDVVVLGADVDGALVIGLRVVVAPAAVVVDRSGEVTLPDGRVTASPPDPPDPQPTRSADRARSPIVKGSPSLRMAHMMTEFEGSARTSERSGV